nr:hypothetical protein BaRGS_024911 [Batillaria attramentaria]
MDWLVELSKHGFGRTREDLKDMVKKILDERGATTIFKNNRPGKDWVKAFFERTSQALGKERAVVSKDRLQTWFQEMKDYIDGEDASILTSPDCIFNADESGFSVCPKTKRVISQTGTKHVYSVTSGSRQQVTVLACISANGQYVRPLLIFPYKRDPQYNALEGFEESFNKSDNGWITESVFLSFLKDIFIPYLEKEGTRRRLIVLFVDGHSSHRSLEVSNICSQEGVILYCLKAHASHLIQPLDQALFGAIKPAWTEEVRKLLYANTEAVTLRTFASVFKKAWTTAARPETAMRGFTKSGLFPYNPDIVLNSDKLKPSATFKEPVAAFDTLDHSIMLRRLDVTFGIRGFDLTTGNEYKVWSSLMDDMLKPSSHPAESLGPTPVGETQPAARTIGDLLTLPSCPKKVGVKRSQPPLPASISGEEYREMLLEKKGKIEEEQQQKEERKRQREERKKERLAQAEEKKKRQEEKKRQREGKERERR